MMLRSKLTCLIFFCLAMASQAEEIQIKIRSDYPGGNIIVVRNDGDQIELTPDLRGGKPWFYWNFAALADRPGRVTFTFAGQRIGVCGPAISQDEGVTWQWLGHEQVTYDTPVTGAEKKTTQDAFCYDFTEEHLQVRFAVAIPYVQRDLEQFLNAQAKNGHLTRNVLTRTAQGTPVDLLTVGEAGPEKPTMLLTARHHACESMASYVVEGFVGEALSDSPCAVDFRNRFCLQVVPIVDSDGVQAGDQGKWREPHDHNRDYGQSPLYPAVQAIQDFAAAQKITYALDIHCPALRGDVHEAFYFDGLALSHFSDNLNELIGWIREERPPSAGSPLNLLKKPKEEVLKSGLPFSHYFARQPEMVFAATLEVPYTQRPCAFDAAMARRYGTSLLKAWTRTIFLPEIAGCSLRKSGSIGALTDARKTFQRSYRGQAEKLRTEAESEVREMISPTGMKIEARLQLATIALFQKLYDSANEQCASVIADQNSTTQQRATAYKLQVAVACSDETATPDKVESVLAAALQFADPGNDFLTDIYERVSLYYERRSEFAQALKHTRDELPYVPGYRYGNTLLRIANQLEQLQQTEEAIATRMLAVEKLRPALDPPPKSVFGAMMVIDLFDAVAGLPSSTLAEKQAVAKLMLDHPITSVDSKERVRKALAAWETK